MLRWNIQLTWKTNESDDPMKQGLYSALMDYCHGDILPMHMPGHKRNQKFKIENPYGIDVTEVTGLDNLHNPEGVIRQLMERVSERYHSDCSYLLVNGSTCGILSAITACCHNGDRILVARNCHKSVYNAIKLLELRPVYLYPSGEGGEMESLGIAGIIRAEDVEKEIKKYNDISCVVITSPTYEGVVSPVGEIADTVHRYHVPLVVDEAHGAHFQWHEAFPDTALTEGADLVIESLHKTLPAFTQTGVLHMREGLVDVERLRWSLQTFQSSSPSYLLMAGMDRCFSYLEEEGQEDFERYIENLRWFRGEMKKLKHLRLFESAHKESSKLVIVTDRTGISGGELSERLFHEFRIELEMSCGDYCIAMTSVCDERIGFERLAAALLEIDESLAEEAGEKGKRICYTWQKPRIGMYSFEAARCKTERICVEQSQGRLAAAPIYLYPPGVPMVVEGEEISKEIMEVLRNGLDTGQVIYGVEDGKIQCICL